MSRRCQHNHHRPRVEKGHTHWFSVCRCGRLRRYRDWHAAFVDALAHSQELTS